MHAPDSPLVELGGGGKGSQPMERIASTSLIIEKGLDGYSTVGVSQADVRQYFDLIKVGKASKVLHEEYEVEEEVAAMVARCHLLPKLELNIRGTIWQVPRRKRGLLTGATSSPMLARLPIERSAKRCLPKWQLLALELREEENCEMGRICFSHWADNLYEYGTDPASAMQVLEEMEVELAKEWNLEYGRDSKEWLVLDGSEWKKDAKFKLRPVSARQTPETDIYDTDLTAELPEVEFCKRGWRPVEVMKMLGAHLSGDASISVDLRECKRSMWRSFHGNIGKDGFKGSLGARCKPSLEDCLLKIKNIMRSTLPIIRYRWSRWPWTKARARQIDDFQALLVSRALSLPWAPGETAARYFAKRTEFSRNLCVEIGRWSDKWERDILLWERHMQRRESWLQEYLQLGLTRDNAWWRERNKQGQAKLVWKDTWLERLRLWRDEGWLSEKRMKYAPSTSNTSSVYAGRTKTRTARGKVHKRWERGLAELKQDRQSRMMKLQGAPPISEDKSGITKFTTKGIAKLRKFIQNMLANHEG